MYTGNLGRQREDTGKSSARAQSFITEDESVDLDELNERVQTFE